MNSLGLASFENIKKDIEYFSQFNSTPGNGVTRVAFSDEELKSRNYVRSRMKDLELDIREDALGNIIGRLEGTDPNQPSVWTGSHIDTVINGGMFDGTVGVFGALEAIRLIKESKHKCSRNIEVVVFIAEEPTRFGKGCIGSRAMAGLLTSEDLRDIKDWEEISLEALLTRQGYNIERSEDFKIPRESVYAFVELHIEQGEVLDQICKPIGIVKTICGPTSIHVHLRGKQAHAGSTPMSLRHDALMAASEIFLELEKLVKNSESPNMVGTVGKVEVYPNASNVIPGEVFFTIDIRDSDFKVKDDLVKKLFSSIEIICTHRQIKYTTELLNHDLPREADKKIIEILKKVAEDRNYTCYEMTSGAYHDAMFVSNIAPFGMIFVPSKGGISHSPKEWTDYIDIAKGVDALADTLIKLADD